MDRIVFRPGKTTRTLFAVLGALVLLHLLVVFCHLVLHVRVTALTQLVDLDLESNLPTFFNSALFFIAAFLFGLHGRMASGSLKRGWFTMAAVFIFLGVDESSQVHEKFMSFTNNLLHRAGTGDGAGGWLFQAWVIPYVAALLVLAAVLARWFLKLDAPLRRGLVISGAVYVAGAVFMEMAGGKLALALPAREASLFPWLPCELYGDPSGCWLFMEPGYIALYTLEETLEMTGLILCVRALLMAFEARNERVFVAVESGERAR
ncbi:MAG: hypothetical protein M9900_14010 [Flavobacteriales bacterium]|nr:hypothetical protein [Flavobacteriales bacterium]